MNKIDFNLWFIDTTFSVTIDTFDIVNTIFKTAINC